MADSPRCFLCRREDEILAGTYTRVNFGGDIGIVEICDTCSSRADIPPREWIQDHGGYALVIDDDASESVLVAKGSRPGVWQVSRGRVITDEGE